MTRHSLALIILFGTASGALGQPSLTKGSFVGLGLSAFKSGYGEGFLPALHTGVFARVEVLPWLGIRPELSYSKRGENSRLASTILEYVDGAVLADVRMTLSDTWGVSVHAMAGPQWSRMFQALREWHDGDWTHAQDVSGSTSTIDAGWLFGTGAAVDIGNGALFADVRFYLGTHDLTIPGFGYPMLNRSVNIVAGFEF